jgi:3-oxoadipate enol-lactonase
MLVIVSEPKPAPHACKEAAHSHDAAMSSIATARGRIGVDEAGRGDALPIVFLHGVGSDKSVWVPQLAHFAKGRRALAIAYPGYGESEFVEGATRDDYAASIFAALDALDIGQAHICGLSLGGVIALAMHAARPDRCASLIIADSFAVHPDGQGIYDRSVAASHLMTMREMAEARVEVLLGSAATDELRRETVDTMAAIDPAAFRLGAAAVWLADQRDRASVVGVPTLILCGDEDRVTPPALSEELGRLIAGSKIEMIPASGHLANAEQRERFNAAIDSFLMDIETPA